MTAFLSIPLALAVPALEGVLLLRILEGRSPVLYRLERLCAGLFIGLAGSAYLIFWAVLAGVPLTFWGFLSVHVALMGILLLVASRRFQNLPPSPTTPLPSFRDLRRALPPWMLLLVGGLALWTILKIGAGAYDLLSVPAYFDDTYANWNMRAKAFYVSESLLLDLPREHEMYFGGRVPSYPLTVYFTKVWLAMVHGGLAPHLVPETQGAGWSEAVVNSVHIVWFVALLGLLFFMLLRALNRDSVSPTGRETSFLWACCGVYTLVSLPLFLVHGTNPYSDVAMAASLFLPLSALFQWSQESDPLRQRPWFLLLCTAASAMLFVKSEALLLFLPPLTLLVLVVWCRHERGKPGAWGTLATYAGAIALVAVPWTLFKVFYALEFGNAQSISGLGMALSRNEGVPGAIFNDLFYTGSYLLFFPVLLLLLARTVRTLVRSPLGLLLAFLGAVFLGQFLIYYLTPLGPEAIRHTGFGRGMVQLLPSLVFLAVQLLAALPLASLEYSEETLREGYNTKTSP